MNREGKIDGERKRESEEEAGAWTPKQKRQRMIESETEVSPSTKKLLDMQVALEQVLKGKRAEKQLKQMLDR